MKSILQFFGLQRIRPFTVYHHGQLGGAEMEADKVRKLLVQARSGDIFKAMVQVIEDKAVKWQELALDASLQPGDQVRHYTGGVGALADLLEVIDEISTATPEA